MEFRFIARHGLATLSKVLARRFGVPNYVSLFTLSILNISLRIGAKNLGLLISTTFIKIPLSSTAHYSENDYYNRKYSCYAAGDHDTG